MGFSEVPIPPIRETARERNAAGGRRRVEKDSPSFGLRRRGSSLLEQFLTIVPDKERFFFGERPMEGNAREQVLTCLTECLYVVLNLHRSKPQWKRCSHAGMVRPIRQGIHRR